jgi:hypothetical protein
MRERTSTPPTATPDDFANAVNQTINELAASNLVLRAQLIAQEIAEPQPDLVGLQEAAVCRGFHRPQYSQCNTFALVAIQLSRRGTSRLHF